MTTQSPTLSSRCSQTTVSATCFFLIFCEMAYTDLLETVDE